MKRIAWWLLIFLLWTVKVAETQDPNPQTSFSTTLLYAQPSLYLNFNDFSTSFLEQISGLNFGPSFTGPSTVGSLPTVTTTGGNPRIYMMNTDFTGAGTVSTLSVQFDTAPTAGATYQILVATDNGSGSYTITAEPGSITVAATTAVQTFTSGSGLPVFSVAQGQTIGFVVATGATGIGYEETSNTNYYSLNTATVPAIGTPTTYNASIGVAIAISATVNSATTTSPGTTTPRQPGFDSTQINNTSAEFTYNAWNAAPNATLGAIDWDVPYTLMVHIDRLNWSRTGTLVLASKGDLGACVGSISTCNVTQSFWQLFLRMNGLYSQLCFMRSGSGTTVGTSGGGVIAQSGICTQAGFDAVPNGYNYNIMVTDNGTGASGYNGSNPTPLNLYINGLGAAYIPETAFSNTYSQGFGYAALSITSAGSGFTGPTAFTSTGGGTNCSVAGSISESGGALNSITITNNYGCTSNPTIVLTDPTGTGGSVSAVAQVTSMNSTALPLLVPGYVSSGIFYGVAGATSTQTSTYVDEFAIFPNVISQTALQGIFYQTKFYQIPSNTVPANRRKIIFSDDGCGDIDDAWALQVLIAADNVGYVNLVGVDNDQINNDASPFIFRQMLDQAGKANIMVGVTSSGTPSYTGWCVASYITAYNASTPQNFSAYPSAVTMFRTVLAANPTTPVDIFSAGALTGISAFMQSAPDSISPLTGIQLWNQDAANGAAMYLQGGPTCNAPSYCTTTSTTTSDNVLEDPVAGQYVMANHAAMPMYMLGGTPASSGPGPTFTRTGKDPMFGAATAWFTTTGSLTRQGWDSLAAASLLSDLYQGGVYVTYSGGTGYANSTPFTLSGGGANCAGSGIMTASGGVPNGITYIWGASAQVYQGLGNGCTSTPTVNLVGSTGAGVTLTAYPTLVCVTDRVTQPGGVWTDGVNSTTCDNQYVQPFSQYAAPSGAGVSWPIFSGWLNSLINPPPNGAPKGQ